MGLLDAVCVWSDDQDITGADEISSNIQDLEQYGVTDEQVIGWMNMVVHSDADYTGLDSGLRVTLRTCDNTNMTTTPIDVVDSGVILPARLVAGAKFSWGFCAANMEKYAGVFYDVVSETASGTLNVTTWWDYAPITENASIQKDLT